MKYSTGIILLLLSQCLGAQEKPNIILIVADDLGYGDLGCYGCKDIKTPNIDKLSSEGVRFTCFYANGPVCTPTRAALLSGMYQQRIGGLESPIGAGNIGRYDEAEWLVERRDLGLPVEYSTLPRELKKAGYNTAIVGKWHLGYEEKFRPHNHFFDYSFGTFGIGGEHFYHTERYPMNLEDSNFSNMRTLSKNGKEVFRDGYYSTHLYTDEAKAWLNQQNNKTPFFLYLPYSVPHSPYQGPNDFTDRPFNNKEWNTRNRSRKTYAEMVEEMDRGVGELLGLLDRKKLNENTIVIFFSDNGGTKIANNGIYSGYKGQLYEGGIRVPCIIRWSKMIPHNTKSDQLTLSFDLTFSILKHAGIPAESLKLDGYDIIGHLIHFLPNKERTVFWRVKSGEEVQKAIREGNMKLIVENSGNGIEMIKLFNIKNDPVEALDVKEENPERLIKLQMKLSQWEDEVQSERLTDFKN